MLGNPLTPTHVRQSIPITLVHCHADIMYIPKQVRVLYVGECTPLLAWGDSLHNICYVMRTGHRGE
jgi:hypothetical protein